MKACDCVQDLLLLCTYNRSVNRVAALWVFLSDVFLRFVMLFVVVLDLFILVGEVRA